MNSESWWKGKERTSERECYYCFFFTDEKFRTKVHCTNSQIMRLLKMGHQNVFLVIHSMRLLIMNIKYEESCGTSTFDGVPQLTRVRGLGGECWHLPRQIPARILLYQGCRRSEREKANHIALGLSSIFILFVGFNFPWFSFS